MIVVMHTLLGVDQLFSVGVGPALAVPVVAILALIWRTMAALSAGVGAINERIGVVETRMASTADRLDHRLAHISDEAAQMRRSIEGVREEVSHLRTRDAVSEERHRNHEIRLKRLETAGRDTQRSTT